jgi:hypothetical protein
MNAHVEKPASDCEAINLTALRLDVCNAIATAKIAEFENQTHRLG